jgi:RNA polymerase sigma factor (sigma-70 family)
VLSHYFSAPWKRFVNPELLGKLFDQQAAVLELYAAQWCTAPADIVQEAFIELSRQHPPPDRPVAWLYRVVRNAAISAARSADRRRRHESRAAEHTPSWFVEEAGAALDAQAAGEALQELDSEQSEVVVARLWGGLSFEQIAALTETSISTAHRRYEAGLQQLRERLGVSCPTKDNSGKK